MRRIAGLALVSLVLLPACGGGGGPVAVSDLEGLTAYLVAVAEAESALAVTAPSGIGTASAAQALAAVRGQIDATRVFTSTVEALTPPPEAQEDRRLLLALGRDQIALAERMITAAEARDLAAVTAATRDALALLPRSADEAAGRQGLVAAALAVHPDRPLNQYLTAIAGLWVPLNLDYQRLVAEAQRQLLAGQVAGAAGPYQQLSDRFNAFLPQWDAIAPPADAAPFHSQYRAWAAEGIALFEDLLPALREVDLAALQPHLSRMLAWSEGVNRMVVMRNDLTLAALTTP